MLEHMHQQIVPHCQHGNYKKSHVCKINTPWRCAIIRNGSECEQQVNNNQHHVCFREGKLLFIIANFSLYNKKISTNLTPTTAKSSFFATDKRCGANSTSAPNLVPSCEQRDTSQPNPFTFMQALHYKWLWGHLPRSLVPIWLKGW